LIHNNAGLKLVIKNAQVPNAAASKTRQQSLFPYMNMLTRIGTGGVEQEIVIVPRTVSKLLAPAKEMVQSH
jgi:hypothetical protein